MDEQNNQNIQLPKDILEEIEPLKTPAVETTPKDSVEQQPAIALKTATNLKKIIFFVGIIALILILIAVVYFWVLPSFKTARLTIDSNKNIETQEELNKEQNQVIDIKPDADRDGLSNDEESQIGTDKNKIDTDGDGLTDYEEAKVYHTNPLKADTDNDSVSDGQEVKNNTNPLNIAPDAKLFDLQEEITKLETSNK